MILRRFMQHVKEQNWFAVGLDVVVVIVGIFLGMQASEWNEHRVDVTNDNRALALFAEELDTMIMRAENDIEASKNHVIMVDKLLKVFSSCETISEHESFVIESINKGNGLRGINIMRAGLEAVAQPDVLARIKSRDLTQAVSRIMEMIDLWNIRQPITASELIKNYRKFSNYFTVESSFDLTIEYEELNGRRITPIYKIDLQSTCENQELLRILSNLLEDHQRIYFPITEWMKGLQDAKKATLAVINR